MLQWIARRFKSVDETAALLEQARAARSLDEPEAAREACLAILRESPEHAGAMAILAAVAADQHQFDAGMQWVRRALAADRACVPAHYAAGRLFEGAEHYGEAEASYRQVVTLDPTHARGHTNLGCMLHLQGRIPEAVACYRRALQLEPGLPEALRNYALVAGGAEELREAREGFERHVAAHPRDAQAQFQLGHLYLHAGRHEDALVAYERALALEPEQPEFHLARAQLLLLLGQYEEGWREYDWRWRMEYLNGAITRFSQPWWDGKRLAGTLLVHSEFAFGDVLLLVRYVALAAQRCDRVVVECPAPLRELVERVEGVAQVVLPGEALPPFDAQIHPVAFPLLFGTTLDTIPWRGPYIHAPADRVQQWQARVAATQPRARKVGVVWTGSPDTNSNRERSVTLRQLGTLSAPDISFFSLQKGPGAAQPGDAPEGMHFIDLTGDIHDFSDTAALLTQLDLVVAIDTSVAHLAGAMARPTWVLLPYSADWKYHLERRDMPWYPGMRLFRQQSPDDWSVPLREMAQALHSPPTA